MYSVTIKEYFASPYEVRIQRAIHTRSVKRAFELAVESKPVRKGDFCGVPILLEVEIKKDGKRIFRKF